MLFYGSQIRQTIQEGFSASRTWKTLNPCLHTVEWHKSVWFKSHIPKHAFNMWLVSHDRLPTWDRLISWGLSVSHQCVLRESADESRSHLFFTCSHSIQICQSLFDQLNFTPHTDLESIRLWIVRASQD